MRTETIEIYSFEELSEQAQAAAIDRWRSAGDCWAWAGEWWDSAQAFSAIAPIEIVEADYDCRHVVIRWAGDPDLEDLEGLRAWKWLQNNGWFDWARRNMAGECTLTGYCGDCAFADPIAAYERRPLRVPDLKQVFYEAAQSWIFEAAADCEHAYSDEAIRETIEANDYEFLSDGSMH